MKHTYTQSKNICIYAAWKYTELPVNHCFYLPYDKSTTQTLTYLHTSKHNSSYRTKEGLVSFRGRKVCMSPFCAWMCTRMTIGTLIYLSLACVVAQMHLSLCAIEGPCVNLHLCMDAYFAFVCGRPVASHPSRQVSGRVRTLLQWPDGNLEEERWITRLHRPTKLPGLVYDYLNRHTLMGKHSRTDTVIKRQWEKGEKKRRVTLCRERNINVYKLREATWQKTNIHIESQQFSQIKFRNTPTHTYYQSIPAWTHTQ